MNHTTTTKNVTIVAMLAAIISALTGGTIAISIIQNAAAQTTTDLENSGTDSKFKQKEKNNCTGFTVCCNTASQTAVDLNRAIIVPLSVDDPPPPPLCAVKS
jgi:hypothetical protein